MLCWRASRCPSAEARFLDTWRLHTRACAPSCVVWCSPWLGWQARSEREGDGDALEAAALREGEYVGVRRFTRTLERGGDAKARGLPSCVLPSLQECVCHASALRVGAVVGGHVGCKAECCRTRVACGRPSSAHCCAACLALRLRGLG